MKLLKYLAVATSLLLSTTALAIPQINASQVHAYEGQRITACGVIKQASPFRKGMYLNINNTYPNQDLTLVIWDNNKPDIERELGDLSNLVNRSVCATGYIDIYNKAYQLKVYEAKSLQL